MIPPPSLVAGMAAEYARRAFSSAKSIARNMRMPLAAAILAFAAIAAFVSLFQPVYEQPPAFSAFNDQWNGASGLFAVASRAHAAKALFGPVDALRAAGENATLVVLAPALPYSAGERDALRGFVGKGGTLLIADEGGAGAELARDFGVRLSNATLVDYASFNRRQDLPVIAFRVGARAGSAYAKFPSAILNYPPGSTVLAASSENSFIDFNGNGAIDAQDLAGPFPYAVASHYGNGTVVVVSDSFALTNDLLFRGNNTEFADALFGEYSPGAIVFDESHRNPTPGGLAALLGAAREHSSDAALLAAAAITIIAGVGAWYWRRARTSRGPAPVPTKPQPFRELVDDIRANARVRSEPYTWMVLMQYARLRDTLERTLNPSLEPLSDRELARKAGEKAGVDAEEALSLFERLESVRRGDSGIGSTREAAALVRRMEELVRRLDEAK